MISFEWAVNISAMVLALGILIYVVLDGFDLGVGILFPFSHSEKDRNVMMSAIAPVWDGNATWLIYGGAVLFAAFPVAYSIVLPAFYIPIMVMMISLVFRGLAFEYRLKAEKSRFLWDISFSFGSTLAAFCQGVMLGAMIKGVKIENGAFAGGNFDWLTSFSVTTGFALVIGYALLGASWLIIKTTGRLESWARNVAKPLAIGTVGFIALISMKTPLDYPNIAERWFSLPNFYYLMPVPFLTAILSLYLWFGITQKNRTHTAFYASVGLFILGFIGLAISFWPFIIMPGFTLYEAAAPKSSLDFLVIIIGISLPILLTYTFFVYRVFIGKINENDSYYQ